MTEPAVPTALPPAGWYADPWGIEPWRWWDGAAWTGWTGGTRPRGWFPARRPVDREGGVRGGAIATAGFVVGVLLAIGCAIAVSEAGADGGDVDLRFVAAQLGLWSGLLGACVVAVHRHGTGSLRDLGLTIQRRDFGIGTLGGLAARVASIVIAIPFVPLLRDESTPENPIVDRDVSYGWLAIVVVVVMVAVLTPIIEELFFRGLVQGVLTRRWGAFVAVFAQSALFASVHVVPGMSAARIALTVLTIGVAGLVLGVLRWRYQRIGPSIVAHGVFNAIALIVLFSLT